jgi:hypothetical protein
MHNIQQLRFVERAAHPTLSGIRVHVAGKMT